MSIRAPLWLIAAWPATTLPPVGSWPAAGGAAKAFIPRVSSAAPSNRSRQRPAPSPVTVAAAAPPTRASEPVTPLDLPRPRAISATTTQASWRWLQTRR